MNARSERFLTIAGTTVFFALVLAGLGACGMWLSGASPARAYARLLAETLGSPYGIGQTLFKATPLVLTGLAVSLPMRAGLFNIGGEGQLCIGAFAAAWVGLAARGAPGPLLVVLCVIAAFLAGAAWGFGAGLLRARFGAHEVISTIMSNFVAIGLTTYLVTSHLAVPETIHTEAVPRGARFPRLSAAWPALHGSAVNGALVLALAAALGVGFLLWRTRVGFEIRAVGGGRRAAEACGISALRVETLALALGGGLAGLAGVNEVLGYRYYFSAGFSEGVGFMGIAVALLGRKHPAGIVAAAVFLGALGHGGLVINDLVPREVLGVAQGLVIVCVLVAQDVVRRVELGRRKRRPASSGPTGEAAA